MKIWSEEELLSIRRGLHQIPEIGLQEYKTQEYLLKVIEGLPQDNIDVKTWQTAVIVRVKGTNPKKTIGWRSDIDGLPIIEETGLPFASVHEGRMHACGHDCHMTIALGLLQQTIFNRPTHNFVFIFQPAEENESGGMLLFESGALDEWMPDEIYALHVQPTMKTGVIATKVGTLFAGTCEIQAYFKGKSGHAAYPQDSNDMIIAATQFIQQAQTIVSRNVNPVEGAVVTFGTIHGGTVNNVITGDVYLSGTIRTLTQETNQLTQNRMLQIAKGIRTSFQCEINLTLDQKGYLPVENDPTTTRKFMEFAKEEKNVIFEEAETAMTGEDFGYLLSKIPGTMFWLGVESPYGLHHEKMSPNEKAIGIAISYMNDYFQFLDKN